MKYSTVILNVAFLLSCITIYQPVPIQSPKAWAQDNLNPNLQLSYLDSG